MMRHLQSELEHHTNFVYHERAGGIQFVNEVITEQVKDWLAAGKVKHILLIIDSTTRIAPVNNQLAVDGFYNYLNRLKEYCRQVNGTILDVLLVHHTSKAERLGAGNDSIGGTPTGNVAWTDRVDRELKLMSRYREVPTDILPSNIQKVVKDNNRLSYVQVTLDKANQPEHPYERAKEMDDFGAIQEGSPKWSAKTWVIILADVDVKDKETGYSLGPHRLAPPPRPDASLSG